MIIFHIKFIIYGNKCNNLHYLELGINLKTKQRDNFILFSSHPVMNLPKYRILNTKEKCTSDVDLTNKPKIPVYGVHHVQRIKNALLQI